MMERLINKIRQLDWPELQIVGNNISIENTNIILLETDENNIATLRLIYRKSDEDDGISFNNSYSNLLRLVFPTDFNAEEILTKELKLRQYQQLDEVFKFNSNHINTIQITNEVESYEISNHIVRIAPATIVEIINNYNSFYDEAKSYSKKYVLYRATEFQRSYFGIEKEKKTTTNKGEFNFVIDRFNLQTKRTKSDFEKYLNENDLNALQELTLRLIQKEVYGAEFLTRLNDYFIKIRLEEIIKLGREILSLKSTNLKTATARNVISKIETDARKIKQLESVWQKYFEKYLSFLIFSYQSIYPKIELNVELKKKFPDFIGINHFGGVDIIEIKTHLKNAVTKDGSHDNYAFSSEMSKSIIQTINYMDALIQEKIRKKTQKEDIKGKILEGNIYRPRGIIIISSYNNLAKGVKPNTAEFKNVQRDFTKLRHGLHNIQVLTFDELLNMAENYKDNIVK